MCYIVLYGDDISSESGESQSSQAAGGSTDGESLSFEAAQNVAARSHAELQIAPGTRPADAKSRLARLRKAAQSAELLAWASAHSWILPAGDFSSRWQAQGGVCGQECDVYYDSKDGLYIKRNNTLAYEDWIQFFESVRMHNKLFPDTAYALLGFMIVDGILNAVLSQPAVASSRGASRVEVMEYMGQFGFHHVGNDNYENETVLIQDLHDENVLIGNDGLLYFIDTCIYMKAGASFPLAD